MKTLGAIAAATALIITSTCSDAEVIVPQIKVPIPRVKVNVPQIKAKVVTPKTRVFTPKTKIAVTQKTVVTQKTKVFVASPKLKLIRHSGPHDEKDTSTTSAAVIDTKLETHVDATEAALAGFTAAIAKNPKVASPHIGRALLLARQDRFNEAVKDLDAAIAIDSYNRNAYIHRAILWERFGDCRKALADYEAAEKKGGMEPWLALQARAAIRVRMGDFQHAAKDLEAATISAEATHRPELIAPILLKRAELAREHQNDAAAALALAEKALGLRPNSAEAVIVRGRAYEASGRRAEALADYKKALDMAPASSDENAASIHAWALFRLQLLQQDATSEGGRPHFVTLTPEMTATANVKAAEKRVALVIGNSHYAHIARLPNAERDVAYVAIALLSAGFDSVRIGFDLDKSTFDQGLEDFGKDAAAADWAFVYYAGHGIEVGNKNYLVPVDADLPALRNADAQTMPLETIVDHVKPAHALRVVMLDACRDNPFIQEAHRAQSESRSIELSEDELAAFRDIGGGITPPVAAEDVGTFLAFATEHGEMALDGDGLDSPFAEAFVREITQPDIEIRQLFEKVRGDVLAATQQLQHPTVYYKLPEDKKYVFVQR
jgi:tetratricopeptide (TPR) repeat protein